MFDEYRVKLNIDRSGANSKKVSLSEPFYAAKDPLPKGRCEPVIAELERPYKRLDEIGSHLAEDHLLKVIGVFRMAEPRIEEPLRARIRPRPAKLGVDRTIVTESLPAILEREPPLVTLNRRLPQE